MPNKPDELHELIDRSLAFQYYGGGERKPYRQHLTEWRNLPFLVVVYVEEGRYFYEIEGKGRFPVDEKKALLIPAGVVHKVGLDGDGVLSFAHVQFSIIGNLDFLSLLAVPFVTDENTGGAVAALLDALSRVHNGGDFRLHEIVRSKMLGFRLLHAMLAISESGGRPADIRGLERLSGVLKYMQAHLHEPIGRGELAGQLALSETRFHYVFKEVTGLSPIDYIRRTRLSRAQALLVTTNLPVGEIAARVGYREPYHFSKLFKSRMGMSPLKYRKTHGEAGVYMHTPPL